MKSFQQSLHLIKIKDHTRIQAFFFKWLFLLGIVSYSGALFQSVFVHYRDWYVMRRPLTSS